MAQDVCSALNEKGLSLKLESLLFMADGVASVSLPDIALCSFPVLESSGHSLFFERVPALPRLGVLLSPSGETKVAVEHRIIASQHHYWSRKDQLQCKVVPKRARLARLYQTAVSSLLWGAGGWFLSRAIVARLESLELSYLRRVPQVPRSAEGFVAYMKKGARVSREALSKYRQPGVAALAFARVHGWAGHLARLPRDSPVARAFRFRDKSWWREQQRVMPGADPRNVTGWRHHRPGRFPQWEDALELFDPHWLHLASDREGWRRLRPLFVAGELVRFGAKNSPPVVPCSPAAPPSSSSLPPSGAALAPPRLFSSLFSSLPSSWDAGLHVQVLLGVSALCLGCCSSVQPTLLGFRTTVDTACAEFKKKILLVLLSVATSTHSCPASILRVSTSVDLAMPRQLARLSAETLRSQETRILWPEGISPQTKNVSLRAHFASYSAGSGSGGVGVCLLLDSGPRLFEIFHFHMYLGGRCSAPQAELQACGIAMLALARLLAWLARRRRELAEAAPPFLSAPPAN